MSGVEIIFIVVATIQFLFLFVIWRKSDWFNFILKVLWLVMVIVGVLIIYDRNIIF